MRPDPTHSSSNSVVIRNPDSTKNRSTPRYPPFAHPNCKWYAITPITATPRNPFSAGRCRPVTARLPQPRRPAPPHLGERRLHVRHTRSNRHTAPVVPRLSAHDDQVGQRRATAGLVPGAGPGQVQRDQRAALARRPRPVHRVRHRVDRARRSSPRPPATSPGRSRSPRPAPSPKGGPKHSTVRPPSTRSRLVASRANSVGCRPSSPSTTRAASVTPGTASLSPASTTKGSPSGPGADQDGLDALLPSPARPRPAAPRGRSASKSLSGRPSTARQDTAPGHPPSVSSQVRPAPTNPRRHGPTPPGPAAPGLRTARRTSTRSSEPGRPGTSARVRMS